MRFVGGYTILSILFLIYGAFSLEVCSPLYHLMITLDYLVNSQLTCGAWISCDLSLTSGLLRTGAIIYPFNPEPLKKTVLYMDSLTIGHSNFTDFIDQNAYEYFNPLLTVLSSLAYGYGYSDSYTTKLVETWVQRNFGYNGIFALDQTHLSSYYGVSNYDYLATLLALAIAFKSQMVDGYLNGSALNATLNPDFWQELTSLVLAPPPSSILSSYSIARSLMTSLAILLNPNTARVLCPTYVESFYNATLSKMKLGEYINIDYLFTAMMNASSVVICHIKYGYFENVTEYEQVLTWIENSYVAHLGRLDYNDGGALLEIEKLAIGLNPNIMEIADPEANATQLALQDQEMFQALQEKLNTTAITVTLNNTATYTYTVTNTLTSLSTILYSVSDVSPFTVTALPSPSLLTLVFILLRSRKGQSGQSSSRPHSPQDAA